MTHIPLVTPEGASQEQENVLKAARSKMGRVPNIVATMANSPAVANAYLSFSAALAEGSLPARLREQIALIVGQQNECEYCLAAHSTIGKMSGLSESEVLNARQGHATDAKEAAAITFAAAIVNQRGNVSEDQLAAIRDAGYSDGEIAEIIANVSLNIFTNYFNHVANPEVDFPAAAKLTAA